jgi:CRP-like cAMP-binding protein
MNNPFVRKLEYGADLNDEDRRLLERVSSSPRRLPARKKIIEEGQRPRDAHLVMEGYACRYKILPDGKRHMMALFVPGDVCDFHVQILGEMDHSIATISEASVVDLPPETIEKLVANPRINRALWWMTLVDEGTLREWLVNMAQRDAASQMAHLFCELHMRMDAVGLVEDNSFYFPLTQEELADVLGLTAVHVNRTLMKLREKGLVEFGGKRLTVLDLPALRKFADFDPNYLHLRDREKRAAGKLNEYSPL